MGKRERVEIPFKFPSLNEYIAACRSNRYMGATMKRNIQNTISYYLCKLPVFEKPAYFSFIWVEGNHKRDWDNVTYAKKFILDALVGLGKLKDDRQKFVKGWSEEGAYEKGVWAVIVEITEIDEEEKGGRQ